MGEVTYTILEVDIHSRAFWCDDLQDESLVQDLCVAADDIGICPLTGREFPGLKLRPVCLDCLHDRLDRIESNHSKTLYSAAKSVTQIFSTHSAQSTYRT
jgi:hypothetical protein